MMTSHSFGAMLILLAGLAQLPTFAQDPTICFESRQGASEVTQKPLANGVLNVKCSPRTGGVLWWGDPFDGTQPLGNMPIAADYSKGQAVVKPRESKLVLLPWCGTACHNGIVPPGFPKDKKARPLAFHQDVVPDSMNLQHGKGAIWCLDCHDARKRNKLVDNFGQAISFNEPQKLCGKCHGQIYRDWRDGIHGKRIGEWAPTGKKRWFVCTECHNPHDIQQGTMGRGFAQLQPEKAPALPKGLKNISHELTDKHAK